MPTSPHVPPPSAPVPLCSTIFKGVPILGVLAEPLSGVLKVFSEVADVTRDVHEIAQQVSARFRSCVEGNGGW